MFGRGVPFLYKAKRYLLRSIVGLTTIVGLLSIVEFLIELHPVAELIVSLVMLVLVLLSPFYIGRKFQEFSTQHPELANVARGVGLGALGGALGLLVKWAVQTNLDGWPALLTLVVGFTALLLAAQAGEWVTWWLYTKGIRLSVTRYGRWKWRVS